MNRCALYFSILPHYLNTHNIEVFLYFSSLKIGLLVTAESSIRYPYFWLWYFYCRYKMNCVFPDRVGTSMFFGSPATSSFGWKYWICHFACLKGGYTVFNLENCAPHKCHKNLKWNLLYYLRKMLRLSHILRMRLVQWRP